MAKKEHTINEVYEVLTDFVGFTKNQFEKVEKEFEHVGTRFELVNGQLVLLSKEIKDIKENQQEMGKDIKILKEDVVAIGKSVYKHDTVLESHRKRIHALEER